MGAWPSRNGCRRGTVYTLHSGATGSCPSLDWHLVSGTDNSIAGMIGWNNMKSMAHASGTFSPDRHVNLTATEVGGAEKTATIMGTALSDRWLLLDATGPGIECKNIKIPINREWGGKQ